MKTSYTCPMYPEVVSDKPGRCPKCGMNLVKQSEAHHVGGDCCASAAKELETQEQEPTSWWERYLYKLGKKPSFAKGYGRAREAETHGKKSHDCCH